MIAASAFSPNAVSRGIPLVDGWEMASTANPATPATLHGLRFIPARVPGTVASNLREQGAWRMGDEVRFDASEHWFRCAFDSEPPEPGEEIILRLGGIATIAGVWLNGEEILKSDSMFAAHDVDVSALMRDHNELLIVCRPLSPALRERRRQQPALRWRTRVVAEQQLRWYRTTLLGRAPGFAREPEPVGPWRPVTLVRQRHIVVEEWSRQVKLDGSAGIVAVQLRVGTLPFGAKPVSGRLVAGDLNAPFEWHESGDRSHGSAVLRIPNVLHWWPHTHGEPALYPVRVELQLAGGPSVTFEDVPVGFRSIDPGAQPAGDAGLALQLNGTPIFCRGVIWTPCDPVSLNASAGAVRERLRSLRDAGFNLIRLAGTTVYEDETFHRLCDELGLMVWQDMMFANMDYPYEDGSFRQTVCAEAEAELSRLSRHPSTTIVCGNSEIEQQVGMLGLDPEMGRGPFFGEELPSLAASHCPGVPYIPSAPCGGDMPFRTRSGVANYFGVGAYLRPLEDARRAEVRFASECLAFANVPEPETMDQIATSVPGGISPTHPVWKRGVPRDSGAGWDFEDVRDHYLKLLYSVDPVSTRYSDASRYWELSRMVSGEVMAEVFGEWRRPGSPCGGGIVLWSADLEPGAGWGILDSHGQPKAAYWFLKRSLAPCAIWTTDEGANGVDIHVANDRPEPVGGLLRIALYRAGEQRVAGAEHAVTIPEHSALTFGLEQILGRFADASYAFRFGPPGHDLIAVGLYSGGSDIPLAQSFRFPAYFGIEPGGKRRIILTSSQPGRRPAASVVTAVNAEGRLSVPAMGAA